MEAPKVAPLPVKAWGRRTLQYGHGEFGSFEDLLCVGPTNDATQRVIQSSTSHPHTEVGPVGHPLILVQASTVWVTAQVVWGGGDGALLWSGWLLRQVTGCAPPLRQEGGSPTGSATTYNRQRGDGAEPDVDPESLTMDWSLPHLGTPTVGVVVRRGDGGS